MPVSSRARTLVLVLLVVLGVVLLGALGYLLALRLDDARLVRVHSGGPTGISVKTDDPLGWLIAALAAAVAAIACSLLLLRRFGGEAEARSRLKAAEAARDEEASRREKVEAAWRAEREWNRELRERLTKLQREQGVLGRGGDVRHMVLTMTISLVGAEKGMLLARDERDAEGDLRVVCSENFDQDPQHSAVAQRFAQRVIERDTMVREDDPASIDREKRTPADEEVRNLLAIPIYLQDEFSGVVICANRAGGFAEVDDEVLVAVGDHAGAVLENSRLHGDLRNAYLATVRMLADAIEVKDPQLRGHSDAVSGYVMAVADRMDFEPREREELIFGSLLHDVGKLGISERILLKPGPLSDEERRIVQLHPRIGYHLVCRVPALTGIASAVLHHHERFDGEGYPERLEGEQIPLAARIIAVADAFNAMTVRRPYSDPRPVEDACAELERCAGSQFDPEVVRLFVEQVRRRPPDIDGDEDSTAADDPELELRHGEHEFVLGARSFGITDSLTMLYSRRHFHDSAAAEAHRAAVQGRSFTVILGELTNLREVNARHGYGAGDDQLQQAAISFARVAARCSCLAFRAGGAKLALITDGSEIDDGDGIIEQLQAELGGDVTVRLASAAWRVDDDGEAVIARANEALATAVA